MSVSGMASDPPTTRECIMLLTKHAVGRVGFVASGQPMIFPVNYAANDDGQVVFRTGEHGLLSYIGGTQVAFEIDGYDVPARAGWCVQVLGIAREITDAQDPVAVRLRSLRVEPWDRTAVKDRWFEITPSSISGRRIDSSPFPDGLQGWFAGVPMS